MHKINFSFLKYYSCEHLQVFFIESNPIFVLFLLCEIIFKKSMHDLLKLFRDFINKNSKNFSNSDNSVTENKNL